MQRVVGYDVARALAIMGMVIVNFKLTMSAYTGNAMLLGFTSLFEGRASALFVILAGVGISFITRPAHTEVLAMSAVKAKLIKRGVTLMALGLCLVPIWPADILHFYGLYFVLSAFCFHWSDRRLVQSSVALFLLFPLLLLFVDYDLNWNWQTYEYANFWTLDGMVRHWLFNGFHPLVPWAAFLLFGIWLGRQPLHLAETKHTLLKRALLTLFTVESALWLLRYFAGDASGWGLTPDMVTMLFTSSIIPPLPHYVVSAIASSVLIILVCMHLTERWENAKILAYLAQMGKLSLTLYLAHVFFGIVVIDELHLEQGIEGSLLAAMIFNLSALGFSVIWLKRYDYGPMEFVFKKLNH